MMTAPQETGINARDLFLPDLPPEWEAVDEEMAELLKPDEFGMQTPEQLFLEEHIAANRWFLVKNTLGWRCKRCRSGLITAANSLPGTIHPYITVACQPRPFNGLNEVLMFWKTRVDDTEDAFTARLGESIDPISAEKADEMYLRIEMVSGRDLRFSDFRARYIRRYKEFLRSSGWSVDDLTVEQWRLVHDAANREYRATGGR